MCEFPIVFSGSASDIVAKAKAQVEANHGDFTGDASSGTFNIHPSAIRIIGAYQILGQQMTIKITQKPFFISCGAISDYLKSHLQDAQA